MTTLRETAYPYLQPEPSAKQLEFYTPSRADRGLAASHAKRLLTQYGFLLQMKTLQRLGRFILTAETPEPIRRHIAAACGLARVPSLADLHRYDHSAARRRAVAALRAQLKIRAFTSDDRVWLETTADTAAQTKDHLPDIINVLLEELVHHRFELPAFSTLERAAFAARERVHRRHFTQITALLSEPAKALIDDLLTPTDGPGTVSAWQRLKREAKRPTNKEIRSYLHHISWLAHYARHMPPVEIPLAKLRQYRALASALDVSEMGELKPVKRYALAVILIRAQRARALDDAGDLFVRMLRKMENRGQERLAEHQLARYQVTDLLIDQLRALLRAYQTGGTTAAQRLTAIERALVADVDELIEHCDEHLAYQGHNFLPFLLKPYASLRAQLFTCLEIMAPRTTSADTDTERMIKAVMSLRHSRVDHLPVRSLGLAAHEDWQWLPQAWRPLVFVERDGSGRPTVLHRRYFELAVLHLIKNELQSGDLCIEHGERYDDYREQLVDDQTLEQELRSYGQITGIDTDSSRCVTRLKAELTALASATDGAFPRNAHAEFLEGRLVLRKPDPEEEHPEVKQLDTLVTSRMPLVGILDILVDVEGWLDLHRLFGPLAGTESRLENYRSRVVTTLFCYGCNLGPEQTARSLKGFNRRQIAWLNLKHVTEQSLERALVKVINAYNRFEIPGYWGTGKHASVDGTKWAMYEENLMSEYHIRYGGYGGIGYYHVSDKYIALFSHFIPCGVYEGLYLIDGLLANESDIQPDTVHGDTHAQSFPVFALSYLLGITLMPRIRGVKHLVFSRPSRDAKYDHINPLFRDTIDWTLIERHLPDMLRVVVSVKLGKITASTILRRLGTYSRKNKLYFAFRELGKVIRTMFLLRYLNDVDLRKTIHTETNKSEQYNRFAKWNFFGNEGVIAENVLHEQRKIVKYNQLVTNMVILHNVAAMTQILGDLHREGYPVTARAIAGLGPYRQGHINRLGDYNLDMRRKIDPPDFTAKVIKDNSQ